MKTTRIGDMEFFGEKHIFWVCRRACVRMRMPMCECVLSFFIFDNLPMEDPFGSVVDNFITVLSHRFRLHTSKTNHGDTLFC